MDFFSNVMDEWEEVLALLGSGGLGLLIFVGLVYGVYLLLSLPLRKQERVRVFLETLEYGLRRGKSVRECLEGMEGLPGYLWVRGLRVVLWRVREGESLGEALRPPVALPSRVVDSIQVGEQSGKLLEVISICRESLEGGVSKVRSAIHFVPVFCGGLVLSWAGFNFFVHMIVPKFRQIFADVAEEAAAIEGARGLSFSGPMGWMVEHYLWINTGFALIFLLGVGFVLFYGWEDYFSGFWRRVGEGGGGLFWGVFPWRRYRHQKVFLQVLGMMLDGGVREKEALGWAARATGSASVLEGVKRSMARLESGVGLSGALKEFSSSKEFNWRLDLLGHMEGGFLKGMKGWLESLDARADQMEEAVVQGVTTCLVILKGVFIGCFAYAVFDWLIGIIHLSAL